MNIQFERLEDLARDHFKNLSNMAKMMNLTGQYLYNYRTREKLGENLLDKLEEVGIRRNYIKNGEGDKLNQEIYKEAKRVEELKKRIDEIDYSIKTISERKSGELTEKEHGDIRFELSLKEAEKNKFANELNERIETIQSLLRKDRETFDDGRGKRFEEKEIDADNNITIYDLSSYSKVRRLKTIEGLPKTTIRLALNIEVKEIMFGFRVSGNIFEANKIFDGNLIIVENTRDIFEGEEIIYIKDNQLVIKNFTNEDINNIIGRVKAVIQYR